MEEFSLSLSREDLNMRVTEQIIAAERLDDDAFYELSTAAWSDVSRTEEAIALLPVLSDVERDIAKIGAVAAAIKSCDEERADELVQKFGLVDTLHALFPDVY